MAEGKSGGKNAIPPCGRKRIFAEFGATPFLKHCLVGLFYVFEKRLQKFRIIISYLRPSLN